MAEPRRLELTTDADASAQAGKLDAVERDERIDALLVQGLDAYFAGRHDEAIHIWTRVLFLDRSHARARAYIDRARTALAERQRKADEMLQASQQFLDRGETRAARDLLTQAVAASGDDERASALRVRLERVERAHAAPPPPASVAAVVPGWTWHRRSPRTLLILGAIAAALLIVAALFGAGMLWVGQASPADRLTVAPAPVRLPVLSTSDAALIRARTLYGRGRLAEALRALDSVNDRSAVRADADALRVEIQRLLLATRPGPSAAASPGRPRQ